MTNQISINIIEGRGTDEEISRASGAAYAVIGAAGATVDAAFAEYLRQWEYLGSAEAAAAGKGNRNDMTGLAAVWVEADRAAGCALTAGRADPDSALCYISA